MILPEPVGDIHQIGGEQAHLEVPRSERSGGSHKTIA